MQPGQMIWTAVALEEPPGKPLKDCKLQRIVLTHIAPKEDAEVRRTFGPVAKRQQQILRLSDEAKQQGALLTQKDLAEILDADVRTIRRDMDQLRQEGFEVPTRGQQNRRILARGSPTGSGPSSSSSRAKNRPKSPRS